MKAKTTHRCEKHGPSAFGAICKHLRLETRLRYVVIKLTPDFFCDCLAWCEKCYAVMEKVGLTDRLKDFADILPVCMSCYKKTLRRHTRIELAA